MDFLILWFRWESFVAGQCLMCDNDEVLQTSWLLRQRADNCSDKWLITSIGQTMFKRQYETSETKNVLNNQHYSPSVVSYWVLQNVHVCSLNCVWQIVNRNSIRIAGGLGVEPILPTSQVYLGSKFDTKGSCFNLPSKYSRLRGTVRALQFCGNNALFWP